MVRIFFIFTMMLFTVISATAALDEGLVFYFTFDDVKGGQILDTSGKALHAEVTSWSTKFVNGKYGDAIEVITDTEECVSVPASDELKINGEITMSAWMYRENWADGSGYWLNKGCYTGDPDRHAYGMAVFQTKDAGWDLGGAKGTVLVMTLGGIGNQTQFSRTLPRTGNQKWHHIAGTYDGAFAKIYLDGELFFNSEGFGPTKVVADTNDQDLQIGCVKDRSQFAFNKGSIDEVALWSRALTHVEIQSVMKGNILAVSPEGKISTTWGDIKR